MDYEKLAVAIKLCGSTPKVDQCPQCPYWASGDMNNCIPRVTADAATAITDLLARAEVAEARCKLAEKCFDDSVLHACETQLELEKKARTEAEARAEKAERERDAAVSDMEALMWHSGDGCNICAHSVEAHRVPYVRLTCYLKGNCEPKWRGIKEE